MTTPPADDGGLFDLLDVLRRGRQMCVFDADGPAPWLGAELPDGTWAPVGDANLHELERRGWVEFAGEQADGYPTGCVVTGAGKYHLDKHRKHLARTARRACPVPPPPATMPVTRT